VLPQDEGIYRMRIVIHWSAYLVLAAAAAVYVSPSLTERAKQHAAGTTKGDLMDKNGPRCYL